MNTLRIGIDLGTTNTLACYMKNSKPTMISFPGSKMLPSIIYLDENGNILVGEKARKRGQKDPENMIRSSKTEMGNLNKTWELRKQKFTPTDVAMHILSEVKRVVLKKTRSEADTVLEAVITVPAYFNSNQIDETKKAAERAGITVLTIVPEPRAAAIANIRELGMEGQTVFVVDLGGGTFDISILKTDRERHYRTLAVDGDRRLGGDNFDSRLYDHIRKYIEDDLGMDLSSREVSGLSYADYFSMIGRVREAAQEAKEELSREEETEVILPNLFPYKDRSYDLTLKITRAAFESMCADLFEQVRRRILKVLDENAGVNAGTIDSVILTGGSCYIPRIQRDVEEIFQKSTESLLDRSTMVAVGAAFIADTINDPGASGGKLLIEHDLISHSLGVAAVDGNNRLVLSKILMRGDEYPCEKTQYFTTTVDNQEYVPIVVFEAGSDKEDVAEIESTDENGNTVEIHDLYGGFKLSNIQKAPAGVPNIRVTFSYDKSRILTVTAEDEVTGEKKIQEIKKDPSVISLLKGNVEPVDFMVLLDTSGSMGSKNGKPMREAKEATRALARDIIDLNTHRMGVVGFGSEAVLVSGLTHNVNQLLNNINNIEPSGSTRMDEAINMAVNIFKKKSIGKRAIILVTDGYPNSQVDTRKAAENARKQNIEIYTIGAGVGESEQFYLSTISSSNKCAFLISDMGKLTEIFRKIVVNITQK